MDAWWPVCTQRRAARKRPVFASVRVLFMIMTSRPIENFRLEGLGRNAGRMFERHLAAEDAGPDESRQSHDTQRPRDHLLLRWQPEAADHFPDQDHGKDTHRQERHRLVL